MLEEFTDSNQIVLECMKCKTFWLVYLITVSKKRVFRKKKIIREIHFDELNVIIYEGEK